MSETKNPGEKKLGLGKLTLKPRTETGVVRQSFSHGRSKSVVVEKVKRRSIGPAETKPEPAPVAAPPRPAAPAPRVAAAAATAAATHAAEQPKSGVVLRTLTDEEMAARAHALADSREREKIERKHAEEEARRRAERDAVDKTEREKAEARKRDEDDRRRHDADSKKKADEVAKKRFGGEEETKRAATPAARLTLEPEEEEAPRTARRGGGGPGAGRAVVAPKPAPRAGAVKQRGRLTLVNALNADVEREFSVAKFHRRTQRRKGHVSNEPKEKLVREVTIPEAITIQ